MAKERSWEKLFHEYDLARTKAKEAESVQEELKAEIKTRLELKKLEEVDGPEFKCTYKFERDRDVFDESLFAQKEPKKYAQWTALQEEIKVLQKKYTKKQPGARKLIITRTNEQEG